MIQNRSKKQIAAIIGTILFIAISGISVSIYSVFNYQEIRSKARQTTSVAERKPQARTMDFVPNEVVINFKPNVSLLVAASGLSSDSFDKQTIGYKDLNSQSIPDPIKKINSQYPIKSLEKVLKGKESPQKELEKLKSKFSKEITSGQRKVDEKTFLSVDLSRLFIMKFDQNAPVLDIVARLKDDPNIYSVSPNYKVQAQFIPNDTYFDKQWTLRSLSDLGERYEADIKAPEAWDTTRGTSDIIVAVIDSGIDYTHPDLGGCIGPDCKVVGGYDFYNQDADPKDDAGHGTHVSGTIAAITDNNMGVAGVCPNCRLMALKFLSGAGYGTDTDAIRSMDYAITHGAKIINNSWGGGGYWQDMQDIITQGYALGVISVAAAGNYNDELFDYPASLDHVISVAASDRFDKKSDISTYGTWVDMAAPGGGYPVGGDPCGYYSTKFAVLSTISDGVFWDRAPSCGFIEAGGKYFSIDGTSMASPHVAGALGLVYSQHPTWISDQITNQVVYTADSLDPENPEYLGKLGSGRLNAYKAVTDSPQPKILFKSMKIEPVNEIWKNGIWEPGETANIFITLLDGWLPAQNVQATLTSDSPYVSFNPSGVQWGQMNPDERKANLAPFIATLSPQTPAGSKVEVKLSKTWSDTENTPYSSQDSLTIDITPDLGWPKNINGISSLLFEDLNRDGTNEIIITTGGLHAQLYTYTLDGHILWKYFIQSALTNNQQVTSGNIDTDLYPEIIYGGPVLRVIEHDGMLKPGYPLNLQTDGGISTVTLADLTGDGINEMILKNGPKLKVIKADTTTLWTRDLAGDDVETSNAVGDIDNNGTKEIVTPVDSTITITRFDGQDYGVTFSVSSPIIGSPILGDIDGNSDEEIVFLAGKSIYAYNHDGSLVPGWPKNLTGPVSTPALADIDNDGNMEIFVQENNSQSTQKTFHGWNNDATPLPNWPVSWTDTSNVEYPEEPPIIINADSDPQKEIVFPVNHCFILAIEKEGGISSGYPKKIINECFESLSHFLSGEDSQPHRLSFAGSNNILISILDSSTPFDKLGADWPIPLHDNARTSNVQPIQGTISPSPTVTPPLSIQLLNGSFEQNQSNWKGKSLTKKDKVISSEAHTGTKSFQFTSLAANGKVKLLNQTLSQLDLPNNTTFTLSGWNILPQTLTSGKAEIKVIVTDKDKNKVAYILSFSSKKHPKWQNRKISFNPKKKLKKNITSMTVSIQYSGIGSQAYFDDITLTSPTIPTVLTEDSPLQSQDLEE